MRREIEYSILTKSLFFFEDYKEQAGDRNAIEGLAWIETRGVAKQPGSGVGVQNHRRCSQKIKVYIRFSNEVMTNAYHCHGHYYCHHYYHHHYYYYCYY